MRNFHEKRGWRNIVQSKPVLILLGVLILFFAWNILGFWNKMQKTEKNKKIVEEKIAELKKQNETYTSEINNLKTDKGKETIFRENLGLAKDGEGEIIILDDKSQPATPVKSSSGFWSFLKNLFK
jgi:cell division protein FtsB